jgi:hypothetical protein
VEQAGLIINQLAQVVQNFIGCPGKHNPDPLLVVY